MVTIYIPGNIFVVVAVRVLHVQMRPRRLVPLGPVWALLAQRLVHSEESPLLEPLSGMMLLTKVWHILQIILLERALAICSTISTDLWYFGPFSHGFIYTPPVELAACPIGPEVRFATPFGPEVK